MDIAQVSTVPSSTRAPALSAGVVGARSVPWYVWCAAAAVTSAILGIQWDISWHRSIGRDSFWTPAHVAIYMCGVLAGISSAYLILSSTFGRDRSSAAVRIWGLRAPLGAFLTAWGGAAMLTSAPFDNWWHNAYGLDVRIVSPPHALLMIGMLAIEAGTLVLMAGFMNRAHTEADRMPYEKLFLYLGGLMMVGSLVFVMEYTVRVFMHTARFYWILALTIPWKLCALARASHSRWAATWIATVYSIVTLGLLWILPLFPAEPKLGPVFRNITQFIPPEFPVLLIVPALAIDLARRRLANRSSWLQAAVYGALFVALFLAVQWPFADFLMSPYARNAFVGAIYFDYSEPPTSPYVLHQFVTIETQAQFWRGIAIAFVVAILSTRIGLAWGAWMSRVKR